MKKFTLTLFLALASLATFAQSTVKTIRVADASTAIGANIPVGTIVIDLTTGNIYSATLAGGGVGTAETITTALAATTPLLAIVNKKSSYSVSEYLETSGALGAGLTVLALTKTVLNGVTAADSFKVYLNGGLLKASEYTFVLDSDGATAGNQSTVALNAASYKFDLLAITYTSNQ